MTGTASTVAVRNGNLPAQGAPGAALDLRSGQSMWTKDQHAALVAMGIPREATSAELGVFLHQCQRTGLDPFSKQIYLIYRQAFENGKYVSKPTTQVGIDGFRVIRDRIAKREGLRVEYEETVWYSADGQACDVWLWDEPPAACKVVVVVDGRRFPSVLRFGEYCQRKKDGALNKMWSEKAAHMIEKCAEADSLRKAFPNDMAGVMLEDSAPPAEDAPPAAQRPRVTPDQARERRPQTVTAVAATVTTDAASGSAPPSAPEAAPAPAEPSEEMKAARKGAHAQAKRVFGDDREARLLWAGRIIRAESDGDVKSFDFLTLNELHEVRDALAKVGTVDELAEFLATGTVPSE